MRSLLIAAVFLTLGIAAAVVERSNGTIPGQPPGVSDVQTYRAIVARLERGEAYYTVIGEELRRRGYATAEVFNWRTPALWTFLAHAPGMSGRVLPTAAVILVFLTLGLPRASWPAVIVAAIMQAGAALAYIVPEAAVMGEAWAGALIGLSVLAYAYGRRGLGCGLGLLALVFRELAAPYCVGATLIAAWSKRRTEVIAWLLGAVAYAGYYSWHLAHVWAARSAVDIAHGSSWVELGGLGFLMARAQWHPFLRWSPSWVIALAFMLVVAGCCAKRAGAHVRLGSAVYIAFFLVAGKGFDNYWGLIAWPAWSLALGYGIDETVRFSREILGRPIASSPQTG